MAGMWLHPKDDRRENIEKNGSRHTRWNKTKRKTKEKRLVSLHEKDFRCFDVREWKPMDEDGTNCLWRGGGGERSNGPSWTVALRM